MARDLIFLGAPGAGKGTQAGRVVDRLGLAHVATGDLLRAAKKAGTPLGLEARGYMDEGKLVPDELVLRILGEHLEAVGDKAALFDGFPRNDAQARALDELLASQGRGIARVIYFVVDDDEVVKRIAGRRTCPTCQRPYHVDFQPPKAEGVCDDDGAELVARPDDTPDKVRTRLGVYHEQTAPLIEYYRERGLLTEIAGTGDPDAIAQNLFGLLS